MPAEFDLIAIGGGAAGLAAAGMAAHLGARTLLIEAEKLGGDCTWTGCIPSKSLLHSAAIAHTIRTAGKYGVTPGRVEVDFARVMDHVRKTRRAVYDEADRPELYERMGIDVRHGRARFVDTHTVEITSETPERVERATGRFVVVCTGASPSRPSIPGLRETSFLTSDSLFELNNLPEHLLILGAGPVGIEMGQAFLRLGSRVTVLDEEDRILFEDDPQLTSILRRRLEAEGMNFVLGADIRAIHPGDGSIRMDISEHEPVHGTDLLVAAGRTPNVHDLNLHGAGIEFDSSGILVDGRCRTSVRHVYAAGDVTGRYNLTHMSDHMAKVAVMNALLRLPTWIDAGHVPRVTFTDPELAHLGATRMDLERRGVQFDVYRFPYARVDRAFAEDRREGSIVVFSSRRRGRILGGSILGARAGELIAELALAMRHGVPLRQISDTIHAYPTYALGVRRLADQWYVQRRSAFAVRALKKLFGYRGKTIETAPDEIV